VAVKIAAGTIRCLRCRVSCVGSTDSYNTKWEFFTECHINNGVGMVKPPGMTIYTTTIVVPVKMAELAGVILAGIYIGKVFAVTAGFHWGT
jgi:hypothetical protein